MSEKSVPMLTHDEIDRFASWLEDDADNNEACAAKYGNVNNAINFAETAKAEKIVASLLRRIELQLRLAE